MVLRIAVILCFLLFLFLMSCMNKAPVATTGLQELTVVEPMEMVGLPDARADMFGAAGAEAATYDYVAAHFSPRDDPCFTITLPHLACYGSYQSGEETIAIYQLSEYCYYISPTSRRTARVGSGSCPIAVATDKNGAVTACYQLIGEAEGVETGSVKRFCNPIPGLTTFLQSRNPFADWSGGVPPTHTPGDLLRAYCAATGVILDTVARSEQEPVPVANFEA